LFGFFYILNKVFIVQFIDEAKIFVKSGPGGNGCVSFRREANIPRGGPDGGDGGRGGHIIMRCVAGLNTLIDFRYQQHFKAGRGEGGAGQNRFGKSAPDLIVNVPVGTQVFDETDTFCLWDFTEVGQEYQLCKGGQGGVGNTHFKSSVNQAPRFAQPGENGQEMWVWLKLKLLSDAGLVGLPNAGKSTFLSVVSHAKPKIADYPFTTLKPQLGVVRIDEKEFVLADLPGLIEGAHEGVGLGIRFLKHVERCGVILHLIDGTAEDVTLSYRTVKAELDQYSELLAQKDEVVVITKADVLDSESIAQKTAELHNFGVKNVMVISAVTGQGVKEVLRAAYLKIKEYRRSQGEKEERSVSVSEEN
jgi:GTPase